MTERSKPARVLDVHAHNTRRSYIAESWWESLGRLVQRVSAARGRAMSHREATEMFASRLEGMSGDALVAGMDEAGVARMVLLPLDYGLLLGEPPLSIEQQNEETAELCARHPERLVAFCGVDPMRGKRALALIERMVRTYGARGVKLHPLSGWYPDDRAVYPVYEKCASLRVPVLIHSGSDPPPLRSKYGRPIYLDDVCVDFPQLRIMCAHMGKPWREEAVDLAERHANLWLDVCGTEALYRRDPAEFYRRLRGDLDALGPGKVCFASDYPYYGSAASLGRWVERFRAPGEAAQKAGISFSEAEVAGILQENGAAWLGGEGSGREARDLGPDGVGAA